MNIIDKKEIAEKYYMDRYVRATTVSASQAYIGVDDIGRCIELSRNGNPSYREGLTMFAVRYANGHTITSVD